MFPTHPEEITAAWLTTCLGGARLLDDARVLAFTTEPPNPGGLASLVVRLRLEYDRADAVAPRTLIAKFPSEDPDRRRLLSTLRGDLREVRFYSDLAGRAGLSVPRCHFAAVDVTTNAFFVLLEDLAPARSPESSAGLSVGQAEHALVELARFHARFWNDPELSRASWLRPKEDRWRGAIDLFISALGRHRERLEASTPLLARAANAFGAVLARMPAGVLLPTSPFTLVHADLHPNNLLFPGPAGGRFGVLDWQNVRLATTGMVDVSRLLVSSLPVSERRRHQTELVASYLEAFERSAPSALDPREVRRGWARSLVEQVMGQVVIAGEVPEGAAGFEQVVLQGQRIEAAVADASPWLEEWMHDAA